MRIDCLGAKPMKTFLKRLWRDKRGNALLIAGAALPLMIGSAGLATDSIQWALWKRQLQRSADSAALAGTYAKFQSASANASVNRDLVNNNKLWVPLLATYPQVSEPADTATFKNAVEVSLAVQQKLGFSSMFMTAAPTISATARAAAVQSGLFCVVALEDTNIPGITIQGSADVDMGCGMISNSRSASVSVDVIGNGHMVTAEPVAGVGGVEDINGVSNEQSYHLPQPDPYAGKYSTDVPASQTCTEFDHASKTAANGNKQPGCYTDWGGGSATLNPGVYYLQNTTIDMQGNDVLSGTGVTLIFTGSTPGHIEMNGNSKVILTAPTESVAATATSPAVVGTCGTFNSVNSCDYANMLMIQSAAAALGNANLINGSNGMVLDGAIYFPRGQINFTGSSAAATKCAMIVARRVDFGGSTDIQNNTTGCAANTKVAGWVIRLIA